MYVKHKCTVLTDPSDRSGCTVNVEKLCSYGSSKLLWEKYLSLATLALLRPEQLDWRTWRSHVQGAKQQKTQSVFYHLQHQGNESELLTAHKPTVLTMRTVLPVSSWPHFTLLLFRSKTPRMYANNVFLLILGNTCSVKVFRAASLKACKCLSLPSWLEGRLFPYHFSNTP